MGPVEARRRPRSGSLRLRVTAGFALGSLLVVAAAATLTYVLCERYLLRQRERSLERQTYVDARALRNEVQRTGDVTSSLEALERTPGSSVVVARDGEWIATSALIGRDELPAELRRAAASGEAARQRFRLRGDPWLAVGVPIGAIDTGYFEVFKLDDLERTLGIVRASLLGAGAIAALLGALAGLWVSRRVLRPVSQVALAAELIGAGNLRTRLEPQDDRDLDRVIASFNQMVEALERRIERDTRFVSDVSHELRSPLTTLTAAAEVMQARRTQLPDRSQVVLDLLTEEIARFRQMVEDLLELSRADSSADELALQSVDLEELIRQSLERAGVEVPVELDADLAGGRFLVDKRRLDPVLANLIENACSHGQGVKRVVVRRSDGAFRIEIEDEGPGVPPSEQTRIFERFARGAAAGRRGGTSGAGLGLALVKEHVRLHGGRVWVEDAHFGKGARFVVEIPWTQA
jgi:two-component system sensor histidine kinase MtrB